MTLETLPTSFTAFADVWSTTSFCGGWTILVPRATKSTSVAAHVIDVLVDTAWLRIRCRHEWRAIGKRVNEWGQERKRATKTSKHKQKEQNASPGLTLPAVVQELQRRTEIYKRTAHCVSSLVSSDLLHFKPIDPAQQVAVSDVGAGASISIVKRNVW